MASIDLDKMLKKIKSSQWGLVDFNWDEPGREKITAEQWPKLKLFMADLVWIEQIGARGFAAMAKKAPNDTLREIYSYFHAEEQRHANAEIALMKRWGMLDGDRIPEPNNNIRLAIEWLDRYSDSMPLYMLGTVIPMLEVALDGALCKFLLDTVEDPLCHKVFARINDDESRHLGVGFSVMEMQGRATRTVGQVLMMLASALDPRVMLGSIAYLPLLNKMRDNIVKLGLPEERLYEAMKKFEKIGGRTPEGRRNPWYRIVSNHGRVLMNRKKRHYHVPVDALVMLTDRIPSSALPDIPSWIHELEHRPTV